MSYFQKIKDFTEHSNSRAENCTYDYENFAVVQLKEGYQVTFQQRDVREYKEHIYDKLVKALLDITNTTLPFIGKFEGEVEISFCESNLDTAKSIAREFNQHSIFDWEVCDIIENEFYKRGA